MKEKLKFSIFLILCFTSTVGNTNSSPKGASLQFHFENKSLKNKAIIVRIIDDYIYHNLKSKEYIVSSDPNGNFIFRSSSIKSMVRVQIEFSEYRWMLLDGFIEPGDSLNIIYKGDGLHPVKKDDIIISGVGHGKYDVIKKVKYYFIPPNNTYTDFTETSVTSDLKYLDSIYSVKKKILASSKKDVSQSFYCTYDAELYGNIFSAYYGGIVQYCKLSKANREIMKQLHQHFETETFPAYNKLALNNESYLDYLSNKAKAFAIMNDSTGRLTFKDLYSAVTMLYHGTVREKVLTYLISSGRLGFREINDTYLYDDVLSNFKNPKYKKVCKEFLNATNIGSAVYPLSLPDTSKKLISINNFKGKTIIIDCWFTGCGSCIKVAKDIKSHVLPEFEKNDDVVFITICVDKSRITWINSIKSGEYTNRKSINLFTAGVGMSHPFIKKYGFQSFPRTILIDKNGNIFSPDLPRNTREMITVINAALHI